MAQEERTQPAITSLPRVEDLPVAPQGYDQQRVQDAFEAFRRHVVQLQAQLRVLQAAGQGAQVDPTGHAVRIDALHLIREAAEFADVLERDAQRASAAQLGRTEQEVRHRQTDLGKREGEIERFRQESERQRAEIVNAARNDARQLLADANARRRRSCAKPRPAGRGFSSSRVTRRRSSRTPPGPSSSRRSSGPARRPTRSCRALSRARSSCSQLRVSATRLSPASPTRSSRRRTKRSKQPRPQDLPTRPEPVAAAPEPEAEEPPSAEADDEPEPERNGPTAS